MMLRSRAFTMCGLSLLCGVLFILQFKRWPPSFILEMEVQTERYARLELRCDQGAGFSQRDSLSGIANGGLAFQLVRFPIAVEKLYNLNLLQDDGSLPLRIRHARLKILPGKTFELAPDQIRSGLPGTVIVHKQDLTEIRGINGSASVILGLANLLPESHTSRR